MKCKEIQEKINLQLKNKRKQKLKEKGITLIALVVTIIILLILAGVTLNMAMNGDGLFSRARNAADKYKKAQEDEAKLISEIGKEMNSEYVGEYVTGYNPTTKKDYGIGTSTSGTGTIQNFSTEEGMKWRIWDYDGTTLRIISEKPTTATLQLRDKAGYNNGVWAINEICRECYTMEGVKGVEVRNLRRSDIEAVSNYDYTKYKHQPNDWREVIGDSTESNLIYYGQTKKYDDNYQSPAMWSNHDKTWTYKYDEKTMKAIGDPDCNNPWEQEYGSETEIGAGNTTSSTKFTQSYYAHDYKGKENEFKNSKYYDMIFTNGKGDPVGLYWLASRYVNLYGSVCDFGLDGVNAYLDNRLVYGYGSPMTKNGDEWVPRCGLRPIVSINLESSGYKLVLIDGKDGAKYKITRGSE